MAEKTYRWDSNDYAEHSSAQYGWALELIPKLRLQGTETVLDIGCGDGKVTLAIADALPEGEVVGIDSSESMIELAQEMLSESNCRNASFELMDAVAITFEDRFDVVFSNAALHWTKNHVAVLEGVKKSLKKLGRILLQMGGKGNAKDVLDVFYTMLEDEKWRSYFEDFSFPYGFYGTEEYEEWLRLVGLKTERLQLIPKTMTQEGKDGLAGWIRTTWLPYTQRVPEDLQEAFISEIVDLYVQAFPMDNNGKVSVEMARLEVEAVKT
jgi:trans-aconitate methyltransferase